MMWATHARMAVTWFALAMSGWTAYRWYQHSHYFRQDALIATIASLVAIGLQIEASSGRWK